MTGTSCEVQRRQWSRKGRVQVPKETVRRSPSWFLLLLCHPSPALGIRRKNVRLVVDERIQLRLVREGFKTQPESYAKYWPGYTCKEQRCRLHYTPHLYLGERGETNPLNTCFFLGPGRKGQVIVYRVREGTCIKIRHIFYGYLS